MANQIYQKYIPLVHQIQEEYGLPDSLLENIITAESHWNPDAASGKAKNLAQFTPETGKHFANLLNIPLNKIAKPENQIRMAGRYLSEMIQTYKKSSYEYVRNNATMLAVAGYNTGETNLNRALKLGNYTQDFIKYLRKETQEYIPKVLGKELDKITYISRRQQIDKTTDSISKKFFNNFSILNPVLSEMKSLPSTKIQNMANFLLGVGQGKIIKF